MSDPRKTLDAEIAQALSTTLYGRDDAHKVGAKLVELAERRMSAEAAVYGDDAYVPRSAWDALDWGNELLRA